MHVGNAGSRVYRPPGAPVPPARPRPAINTERFRSQGLRRPNGEPLTRADASNTSLAACNAEQGGALAARTSCAAPLQPATVDPAAAVVLVAAAETATADSSTGSCTSSTSSSSTTSSTSSTSSGGGGGVEEAAGRELTSAIQGCTTFRELWRLFEANASRLNTNNVAALACRIAKVTSRARLTPEQRGDLKAALFEISTVAEGLLPSGRPRDLALLAAGLMRAGARDRRLLQLLLPRCPLDALRPPELAQLAWAVAKSGFDPPLDWVHELLAVSMRRMRTMARIARDYDGSSWRGADAVLKPRELASLAWSVAVLQRRCLLLSSSSAAGAGAPGAACARIPRAWFLRLQRAALDSLPRLGAAELSILLWSLAALGQQPPRRWLEAVAARAGEVAGAMEERHVAAVAWAVSRMQRAAAGAASGAPMGSKGGGLQGRTEEQLSSSGRNLDGSRTSDEQQNGSGPRQGEGRDGASSLVGLSAPAANALAAALRRRTLDLLPSMQRPVVNCTLVLSAFARMGLPPPPDFMRRVLERVQSALLLSANTEARGGPPESLAAAESALPPHAAGAGLRSPQQQQQRQPQPQQPSPTAAEDRRAAAVATLLAHQAALAAHAAAAARARQRGWGPRDLATLAWALAAVGYRPRDSWVTEVLDAARGALREFSGRELSLLLYSWARLGGPPPPLPLAAAGARAALRPGVAATLDALGASQLLYAFARWSYRAARAAALPAAANTPGGPGPLAAAAAAPPDTSPASAYRASPAEVAALLALFLGRIDDVAGGAAPAIASVAHSLPWAVAPSRLRALAAAPAAGGRPSGEALLDRLARAAHERLRACGPAEVSQIALGFACLGHDPGPEWAEAVAARAAQLAAAPGCDEWARGEMADALSSLGQRRARWPRLPEQGDLFNGGGGRGSSVQGEALLGAAAGGSLQRAPVLV